MKFLVTVTVILTVVTNNLPVSRATDTRSVCQTDFQCLPVTSCVMGSSPICSGGSCTCSEIRPLVSDHRLSCNNNNECLYVSCPDAISVCVGGFCACPKPFGKRSQEKEKRVLCFGGIATCSKDGCTCEFPDKRSPEKRVRCFGGIAACSKEGICTCHFPDQGEGGHRIGCQNTSECSDVPCSEGSGFCSEGYCACPKLQVEKRLPEKEKRVRCFGGIAICSTDGTCTCHFPDKRSPEKRAMCAADLECSTRMRCGGSLPMCIQGMCTCVTFPITKRAEKTEVRRFGCTSDMYICPDTTKEDNRVSCHVDSGCAHTLSCLHGARPVCFEGYCRCPTPFEPGKRVSGKAVDHRLSCQSDGECRYVGCREGLGFCSAGFCECPTSFVGKREMIPLCHTSEECSAHMTCSISRPLCMNGMCACLIPFKKRLTETRQSCHRDSDCPNSCFVGPAVCVAGECGCGSGRRSPQKAKRRACQGDFECAILMDCFLLGHATCTNGSCACSKAQVIEMNPTA